MKSTRLLLVGIAVLLASTSGAVASAPEPSSGVATVDGDYGEWDLTADYFSNMYRAGKADKPVESQAYLRYDCLTSTLYVLVLGEDGVPGLMQPADAWFAVDGVSNKMVTGSSGNDGVPADFAWVGEGFDGDPTHVQGYEASFMLYEGVYEVIIHLDVFDDGEAQTSATPEFPRTGPELIIDCGIAPIEATSWSRLKQSYR